MPAFVRWPGQFAVSETLNGIVAHEDWLPTFAAVAGNPDIADQLREGVELNGRQYRNYIDGYNLVDHLSDAAQESPRHEFWYVNDDGQVVAARYDDWKVVFLENRGEAFEVWREPFVELRRRLAAEGIAASRSGIGRFLAAAGLHKKRSSMPPSRTARTLPPRGSPGVSGSRT